MTELSYIEEDFVSVRTGSSSKDKVILAFGDPVEVLGRSNGRTRVRLHESGRAPREGTVAGKLKTRPNPILQFSMVDVQQGDGMIVQTPKGRKIFIDGGDNKLFARFAAARYPNSTADTPLDVAALIVTHGDADHFAGLNILRSTEKDKKLPARKRLFIRPQRVYHNGLVKGPSSLPDEEMFGRTVKHGDGLAIVDLESDLLAVDPKRLNRPFKSWIASLKHWRKRGPIEFRRLALGDNTAFDFLQDEGITVEVHGPITTTVTDAGQTRDALMFLREPEKAAEIHLQEDGPPASRRFSASHTVNGHSVTLRIRYGNVRFYLTGDLNQEAMAAARKRIAKADFQSEIIKAPHHGSADFDLKALKAMAPVVSLISSGDESSRKEHIHPRATLMGALGQAARGNTSLIFCTELAAFFAMRGWSKAIDTGKRYFGFERTNFGIIHIRTDGERVLVFTHSGKAGMQEAYRFTVNAKHKVRFAKKVKTR